MYLKKLELNGFKSFAFPTILELSPGVTAIVGPNGSGKSNIADAIRWILGEQSMKNIRSQSGKDLIFSGSKTKHKLGKASVSLYLDNQDGKIPLDYSEIVITREIFRDGTSEYFINKKSARLMDVVEILAKANIGSKGFSVINQGMESEILKYTPSELYDLLEDASGVRYLQLKKKRAERRLKSTQTNIEKTSVVLKELLPHLNFLKREANKARKKEELKQKLSQLQRQFFGSKIRFLEKQKKDLERKKDELTDQIKKLEQTITELSEELKEKEKEITESKKKFFEAQNKIEEILDKRSRLNDKLAELKAQIQIEQNLSFQSGKTSLVIDAEKLEEEIEKIYSFLKELLKINNLQEIREKVQRVIVRIEKIIKQSNQEANQTDKFKEEKLNKLMEECAQVEKALEELNKKYEEEKKFLYTDQNQVKQEKLFVLEKKLRNAKNQVEELKNQLREADWNLEQTERDIEEIKENIALTGLNYNELRKETEKELTETENREIEDKINRLKYKIEEIGGIDELTLKEYEETKERYENLSEKLQDLIRAKKDLKIMIDQLTKEIRVQFEENLETINENFNKYFRLLFNGGRASLKQISKTKRLLDDYTEREKEIYQEKEQENQDDEKEEAEKYSKGIEIKATLPGKKIKNLRMFSGGEKALTSIALLFAIISAAPPSFLVLDEVDATLDESNAQRFARLLKEFSKDTQFIIITHNRETMNEADVLYGITMEEGASRVLSLKLEK